MNFIYKDLIKKNIQNLTNEHIKLFALKNDVKLTDTEIKILHNFISNNYLALLEKDTSSFQELKTLVSPTIYQKIIKLYSTYQNYI